MFRGNANDMRNSFTSWVALVLLYVCSLALTSSWHICDVTASEFGAVGDGKIKDTDSIRKAIASCDEIVLPLGRIFLTGPVNLSSHQVLLVEGTLLASTEKADYPLIAPLLVRVEKR